MTSERLLSEIRILRNQLAEAKENLQLIQERISQYVLDVDVPLQLKKQERALQKRIDGLQEQLVECGTALRKLKPTTPSNELSPVVCTPQGIVSEQRLAKVLIMDDHPEWREILTEIVVSAGFDATAVESLASAKSKLQEEPFDIVIADVVLEHADYVRQGLWILRYIRGMHQRTGNGPLVIIVSGSPEVGRREAHTAFKYRDIVVDFLPKEDFDCEGEGLQEALKRAIREKQAKKATRATL